ncbi:WASH complex subunit 2C [Homo sapiens]|uniref:Isoform 7 of WASH complex subunit 2C n=1 Tax=Homo sapiens TaxID=9606 RepID=Q9Y4E1-6|nr:WASH complex subunit 2C isoform 2 [Homo sapiens]KAI4075822.1 WASH complex subunit 2C [Homo sapiens]|eukprot:NP_001162577.1 WASH complex subunit 2C isoform 2 [Homo sapiens]
MMNRTTPDQELVPASEPVWERPWSVEEIRRSSQSWSLAADAGLLQFLQEFSQQTISRTHEIKKQVDGLIRETKATDCRLHNVFNDFLMLSNTQFIENRVYDEEVEEPVLKAEAEKTEQEKTREQKEVDLIPKVQEAVNYGLQVLDSAFEQLDIKAGNSDSEEDDANGRVELILEPKDLYIDRPLPYLIGSKLFMEQEDVGLGELSSEEGSVGSDRGSIVDTEEEKEEEESDEDFAHHSDNEQNQHTTQMSDEEEDDDGCDLFADSEKEEEDIEDIEENTRPKRSRPTSFADELAARIKGDAMGRVDEEPTTLPSGEAKPRKTLKEKKERRTPSDDEEDNLFAPPKLTDEDFSPFGSGGGLFSGGKGLFDDEDEESDLFTEASQDRQAGASVKEESSSSKPGKKIPAGAVSVFLGDTDVFGAASVPSLKEPQKPEQPTPRKSPYGPPPTGLFDDDDGDDDDDFFSAPHSKPSKTRKVQSTADIFGDEEGDLFKEKAVASPEATVSQTDENKARAEKKVTLSYSKNLKPSSETKTQKGLFSDEEDSEDLFSSQSASNLKGASLLPGKLPTSVSLFDDEDEEDNLFGGTAAKKQTLSLQAQREEKAKASELSKKKASALLFSSDEEDQWNIPASQTHLASDSRSKGEPRDSGTLQSQEAKAVKKTSLFEEDKEDDLFAIAKDSQKKTQRVSLLFEDDVDSGGSLFGSPPTSVPPATKKKETVSEAPPLLFSDEEEKEAQLGVKSVDKKVESAKESLKFGRTDVAESEKEGLLTRSAQETVKHSDLFSSSSPWDKGTKPRTKTVLSLFDEEEDKMEDQNIIQAPQKEVGKGCDPDAHPKSTGVFQDEELLFSHKLQKDNDPDVDLFAGTKKTKLLEPSVGSLFGDDEDDDLFSSAKSQPLANLAINPAALLPTAASQISEVKPVLPELAFPSSEHRRSHGLESVPVLPGSGEAGVSFDLPAQADTLHSANKSRVKMRGKRRPQTRAARRLAAQESSEAEDMSVPRGPIAQWADGAISPNGHRPQLRAASGEDSTEEALAAAAAPWEGGPVPGVDTSPFAKSLGHSRGEADLFDSGDIFSTGTGSQSVERTKPKAKIAENPANPPVGGKAKSPMFPALGEASSDDDLFQSAKPKPAKKTNPFPLLEDEDDLFTDQKVKKNETKSSSQQDVILTTQDIFEDDIFATEAIKPSQKTREKEKTLESNLFDDNIDIFADLTVKPKEKSKKKVEAKSIFDDDMDDIFSTGIQAKTTKPKSRSAQAAPEPRFEHKVSNIFDDPLNAFGGQ